LFAFRQLQVRLNRIGRGRLNLDGGIRKADAMVDEIAPALFDSADMRAGVQALLQHGPGQFREKVVFHGR